VAVLAVITAAGIPRLTPGRARDLSIPGAHAVLFGQEPSIEALAFSADGTTLTALGKRGSVQLWDVGMAWPQARLPPPGHVAYGLAISPDGRSVLIAESTGSEPRIRPRSLRSLWVNYWPFRLPNLGSIAVRAEAIDSRPFAGDGLVFSPDGRLVAAGGLHSVEIRERSNLRWRRTVTGSFQIPSCLAFSRDNKLLAVGDTAGCMALFDLDEGRNRFVRPRLSSPHPIDGHGNYGHGRGITTLVFTSDGERLVSRADDYSVKVWDTTTGRLVHRVKSDPSWWVDRRSVLAIVAGDREVVTASISGDVGLWDLETGRVLKEGQLPLGPLVEPNYWLTALAISPDGKILAGAVSPDSSAWTSQNGLIVLWNVEKLLKVPRRR
jgi:WD40 repeat protein